LIISWDATRQFVAVSPVADEEEAPLPCLQISNARSLAQLIHGFEPLRGGYRPVRQTARLILSVPAGSREFALDWWVDRAGPDSRLTVLLDGEWLGGFLCPRAGPYATAWPVELHARRWIEVEIQAAADLGLSIRAAGFR
jgi:hypothetical protein